MNASLVRGGLAEAITPERFLDWPLSPIALRLVEVGILVVAFAIAHLLTPSLSPLRDAALSIVSGLAPGLASTLTPDPPLIRPFGQAAWMLLVVTPATVLPLMGFDAYVRTKPSRVLAVVGAPTAVASGLAFASLVIVGFHLHAWSRMFLTTFGILAAAAMMFVRGFGLRHDVRVSSSVTLDFAARRAMPTATGSALASVAGEATLPFSGIGLLPAAAIDTQALSHDADVGKAVEEVTPHDTHIHDILERITVDGDTVSQRSLAKQIGIAVGLTNFLLKKIAHQGWIKVSRVQPNRTQYVITAAGLAAKERIYRAQLAANLRLYMETRDRIQAGLQSLSQKWPQGANGSSERRILLYGVGEVAEVGFLCLQGTDFRLVGVVGEGSKSSFLGRPVHSLDRVNGTSINGAPFDRVVIMSLDDVDAIRERLVERGVPAEIVHVV